MQNLDDIYVMTFVFFLNPERVGIFPGHAVSGMTLSTTYTPPIPYEQQPSSNAGAPGTSSSLVRRPHGGYNPAIHGDYDPNADYADWRRVECRFCFQKIFLNPELIGVFPGYCRRWLPGGTGHWG